MCTQQSLQKSMAFKTGLCSLEEGMGRHYLHRGFFAAGFLQRQQLTVGIVSLLHDVLPFRAEGAGCTAICRIQQMTVHLDSGAMSREQLHLIKVGVAATCMSVCHDITCMTDASIKGQLCDIRPMQGLPLAVLFKPLMLSLVLLAKVRRSSEKAAMLSWGPLIFRRRSSHPLSLCAARQACNPQVSSACVLSPCLA